MRVCEARQQTSHNGMLPNKTLSVCQDSQPVYARRITAFRVAGKSGKMKRTLSGSDSGQSSQPLRHNLEHELDATVWEGLVCGRPSLCVAVSGCFFLAFVAGLLSLLFSFVIYCADSFFLLGGKKICWDCV